MESFQLCHNICSVVLPRSRSSLPLVRYENNYSLVRRYSLLQCTQVIRNDGELPPHLEASRLQLTSPMMRSRTDGLTNMRLQWAREKTQRSDSQ